MCKYLGRWVTNVALLVENHQEVSADVSPVDKKVIPQEEGEAGKPAGDDKTPNTLVIVQKETNDGADTDVRYRTCKCDMYQTNYITRL